MYSGSCKPPMTERIIEIAEQSAFLNLSNNLLSIRLKDGKTAEIPVGEVQCLILANPEYSTLFKLYKPQRRCRIINTPR